MIVILNHGAGAAAERREIQREVEEAFAQAGHKVEIQRPTKERDLVALAREALDAPGEIIVAGGGDGTVSAVASVVAGTDKALGVLPLGTLNHFAKDLGIPLELPEAVATIAHGRVTEVDVGEVNGRVFINNSSLGLYPRIVADRDALRHRLMSGKWPAFAWATMRALRRLPFLDLRITVDEKKIGRRTPFLFIGNNAYEISGFELGGRPNLTSGRLGLYLAHRAGRLGLVRLALRALCGRLNRDKDFEIYSVTEARIEATRSRLRVATDGEVCYLETPLHYRSRARDLRVVVPEKEET